VPFLVELAIIGDSCRALAGLSTRGGEHRADRSRLHRPPSINSPTATKPKPASLENGTEFQYIRGRGSQWTSNGTTPREQGNRKKHGVDFRTAAKVFLDPYVIEFDDLDATDELRFNAIGIVDGRMLFVTYAMRGAVVRIISARGAEPHEKRKYHEI
jgi:uncharacterized protein